MKDKHERVFAYQLAKTITDEDLEKVAGGVTSGMTSSITMGPSGQTGNYDAHLDVHFDW
ncbi:hypothetical protein [Legionella jordanis]|uniref:Uncharacterized protein n=1 Tax=Legionella jordanis TaxID=456 RepID=A0A0W0V7N7_9GAMM|nr:hypothetical protein [Legionella jordanis]KTD16131.1 hypothetical protein Ljor_0437 [Legionella jordanis]VEH12409.1 Uncharacterised protein [Legionella jordanis]